MKLNNLNIKRGVSGLALAAVALSSVAQASSVNVHNFVPAANPAYMVTEDALLSTSWKTNGKIFISAYYDMINDPLVELNKDRTKRTATLIDSMHSLNLTFGYNVLDRLQVGASTALSLVRVPGKGDQFGSGDSRLFTKLRLNDESAPIVFALMPELWVPTGNRDLFLSNDTIAGGARIVGEHDFGSVSVAGNIGYRYSPKAFYRDLNMKSALPLSLGLLAPIGTRWALNADVSGEVSLPLNRNENPSSVYLGARYRLPSNLIFSLGGAIGSLNGYSSADFRIVAGISLIPEGRTQVVEKSPAPAPVVASYIHPVAVSAVAKKPRVLFTKKEIVISEEVKFENGRAILTHSGQNLLDEVAHVLKENRSHYKMITIEGHTNQVGGLAYNQKLSEARAAAVKEYLTSRGVDGKSLDTVGYGKTRPKFLSGMSREALLAANRRVAFKVRQ